MRPSRPETYNAAVKSGKHLSQSATTPQTPIKLAIERLYEIFARYRFTDMEGDAAFPGSCDPKPLLAAPLRDLPPAAFERFAWKAVSTWGSADDLRHFLPRMLELCLFKHDFPSEAEFLFGKINYAKWRTWPQPEQDAITHAVWLAWEAIFAKPAAEPEPFRHNPKTSSLEFLFIDQPTEFLHSVSYLDQTIAQEMLEDWSARIESDLGIEATSHLAAVFLDGMAVSHFGNCYGDWLVTEQRIDQLERAWIKYQGSAFWSGYFSRAHELAVSLLEIKKTK